MDAVFGDELCARRRVGPAPPMRIEHLIARAQPRRGIAMAVEAPAHGGVARLPGERHVADGAVAGGAADALGEWMLWSK